MFAEFSANFLNENSFLALNLIFTHFTITQTSIFMFLVKCIKVAISLLVVLMLNMIYLILNAFKTHETMADNIPMHVRRRL